MAFTVPDEVNLEIAVEKVLGIPFKSFCIEATGRAGYRRRYEYRGIDLLTCGGSPGMGHNIALKGKACSRYHGQLREIASEVFAMGGLNRPPLCDPEKLPSPE